MNSKIEFKTNLNVLSLDVYPQPLEIGSYVKWSVELSGSDDCLKYVSISFDDIYLAWCEDTDIKSIDDDGYLDDSSIWKVMTLLRGDFDNFNIENHFLKNLKERNILMSGEDIAPMQIEIDLDKCEIQIH